MSVVEQKQKRSEHERLYIHRARINVKSLAHEAKIIREEVARAKRAGRKTWVLDDLHLHRRYDLRREARTAQLALAFLRGRPYRSVERKSTKPVDFNRLIRKINKFMIYHGRVRESDVQAWLLSPAE